MVRKIGVSISNYETFPKFVITGKVSTILGSFHPCFIFFFTLFECNFRNVVSPNVKRCCIQVVVKLAQ